MKLKGCFKLLNYFKIFKLFYNKKIFLPDKSYVILYTLIIQKNNKNTNNLVSVGYINIVMNQNGRNKSGILTSYTFCVFSIFVFEKSYIF